jgi:hypothetical protein
VVTAVASPFEPDAFACCLGEPVQHFRRHGLLARVLEHGLRPLRIGLGLIADRLETVDAVFKPKFESFEADIRVILVGWADFRLICVHVGIPKSFEM